MERRLSAILAADVVGYSRLVEQDEAATVDRLRAHRKDLFEPQIAKHHGRIFKLMGDGLLAEFASVVDAVECAIVLQRAMADRNKELPENQRIDVRIGINLGDIIVEDDDCHGEGVVIAARLQQLADPGGIAVSGTVADHVRHKLALSFQALGQQSVKNITERVTVFRVLVDGRATRAIRAKRRGSRSWQAMAALCVAAVVAGTGWYGYRALIQPPASARTPDSAIGVPVITVLPFQNLTGDPGQDKLGIGVAEDLRDLLWNFPEFQVVSGTSSVGQVSVPADIKEIARRFEAQFVIEGSVRVSGDKTIVTAQLIDGASDTHLWSTRFEEASDDPAVFERTAAQKLSESLGGLTGKLREAYERIAWSKPEAALTEYDYYVRGHTHHMRFTEEEMPLARDIYLAGLKRFPDSTLLRLKVALTHLFQIYRSPHDEVPTEVAELRRLVAEAAHSFEASRRSRFEEYYFRWVSTYSDQAGGDFSACIADAKATVAMTPYDPWVRGTLIYPLAECGDPENAIVWAKESIRQQPEGPSFWPEFYVKGLAWASYLAGHYDECANVIQGMSGGYPQVLAACYVHLGRTEEARDAFAAFQKDRPDWVASDDTVIPVADSLLRRWFEDISAVGGVGK